MEKTLVQDWSTKEVTLWLRFIGLEKYTSLFAQNEIDGTVLLSMSEKDVRWPSQLTMHKFGEIRKFSIRLEKLKKEGIPAELLEPTESENAESVKEENETVEVTGKENSIVIPVEEETASFVTPSDTDVSKVSKPQKGNVEEKVTEKWRTLAEEMEELEAKAIKYAKGEYASDMDAFMDGVPGFDGYYYDSPKSNVEWKKKPEELLYEGPDGLEYIKRYSKQGKPPRGIQKIRFISIVSPDEMYIRSDDQTNLVESTLTPRMQELHSTDYEIPFKFRSEVTGQIGYACAVKDVDGLWHRGRIVDVDIDDNVTVELIDYARSITVTRPCLKPLRSDWYLQYERQIYKCQLCNVNLDSPDRLALLRKMAFDERNLFRCHFQKSRKEPWSIDLMIAEGDALREFSDVFNERLQLEEEIRRNQQKIETKSAKISKVSNAPVTTAPPILLVNNVALANQSTPEKETSSNVKKEPLSPYCTKFRKRRDNIFCLNSEMVCVTYVHSPTFFYAMNEESKVKLFDDRRKFRQLYGDKKMPHFVKEKLKIATACVVKFTVDNEYYRGEVIKVNGDVVDVNFIDVGFAELVEFCNVFPLMKEFAYPALSFACRLNGYEVPDPVPPEFIDRFEKFVQPLEKMWLVHYCRDSWTEEESVAVDLYYPDTERKVPQDIFA